MSKTFFFNKKFILSKDFTSGYEISIELMNFFREKISQFVTQQTDHLKPPSQSLQSTISTAKSSRSIFFQTQIALFLPGKASLVPFFLRKPNCSSAINLHSVTKLYIRSWMIFSRILAILEISEIGRQFVAWCLSPDLNMGIISAHFRACSHTPVEIHLLIICSSSLLMY